MTKYMASKTQIASKTNYESTVLLSPFFSSIMLNMWRRFSMVNNATNLIYNNTIFSLSTIFSLFFFLIVKENTNAIQLIYKNVDTI